MALLRWRTIIRSGRLGLFVLLVVGLLIAAGCAGSTPTAEPPSEGIDGVQTYGDLARGHTEDTVDYAQSPPVGGDHSPDWLDCTGSVYREPVPNENAVHSLEHGAVWITYDDTVTADDLDALSALVDAQPYTLMSPFPGQPSPIVLTAWGVQLGVDTADDPRIEEFLTEYRQGPQTPEPGATCESGMMP